MDIPQVSLPTGGYQDPTLEQVDQQTPEPTSASDASSAAFDLAWEDTPVGTAARIGAKTGLFGGAGLNTDEMGTKMSPEKANAMYPHMAEPFREPVTPSYAMYVADQQAQRQELQRKIENGPDDLASKSRVFGAGLAAHLMDPVEFGVGAAAGFGVGAVAARTAVGAGLVARAGTSIGARAALNFAEGAAAGGAATAVQEAGVAAATATEGGDYDAAQGFKNVGAGILMGGILGAGIKEGSFRLFGKTGWETRGPRTPGAPPETAQVEPGRIFNDDLPQMDTLYRETSPEAGVLAMDHAVKSLEENRAPMTHLLNEALIRESDVNPGDFGRAPYEYTLLDDSNSLGKRFYAAASNSTPALEGAELKSLGSDLGLGPQLTDNPGVANAIAAPALSDSVGNVHEMVLRREPTLLYEAEPLPESLHDTARAFGLPPEEATVSDLLNHLQDGHEAGEFTTADIQGFKDELQKAGYDALVSDGTSRFGVDAAPHNKITVLADDLLAHSKAFEANPQVLTQPSEALLDQMRDQHLGEHPSMWVDETNMADQMKALDAAKEEMRTVSDMSKEVDEHLADMDRLQNLGELSPEDAKAFEAVKNQWALRDKINEFTLNAMKCLGG